MPKVAQLVSDTAKTKMSTWPQSHAFYLGQFWAQLTIETEQRISEGSIR